MSGEFHVVQFFDNGTHEYVRRFVDEKEAVETAHHYCHSLAAQVGITTRVIITDGGDHCVFEWQRGKGVTWPTRAQCEALK